jgi:pilus assembly protein CpaF
VGEVRDGAALDMLQAMNTGHEGSITTVHANSARDALARLETMVLMAGLDLPSRAIREQIASGVHMVVHQERLISGARRISQVCEVTGFDGESIQTRDLFLLHTTPDGDRTLRRETSDSPLLRRLASASVDVRNRVPAGA